MRVKYFAFVTVLLIMFAPFAYSQAANPQPANWYASDFGSWSIASEAPLRYTWNGTGCSIPKVGGGTFPAFTVGTPIYIRDVQSSAHSEIVTVSGVLSAGSSCGFNGPIQYQHTTFSVSSATGGLQEALNTLAALGSSPVAVKLNRNWYQLLTALPGYTSSTPANIIASVKGNTSVVIIDETTAPYNSYKWDTGTNAYVLQTVTVNQAAIVSALGYTPLGNANTGVGTDGQIIMKQGAANLWHTVSSNDVLGWLNWTSGITTPGLTISDTSVNSTITLQGVGTAAGAPSAGQMNVSVPNAITAYTWRFPAAEGSGVLVGTDNGGVVDHTYTALSNFAQANAVNTFTQNNNFSAALSAFAINNEYSPLIAPPSGSYTVTHNGVSNNYNCTTASDCAFYAAASAAQTSGYHITLTGPPGYTSTMGQCWQEPDTGFVNIIGHSGTDISHGWSVIDSGCTSGAMLQFSNNAAPTGARIENVNFNGGGPGKADQIMDIRGANSPVMNNIWAGNFWGTQSAIRFNLGTGTGTGGKSFQVFGNNWILAGNFGGMHAALCTITSDSSGNISGNAACSDFGSGYLSTTYTQTIVTGPNGPGTWKPCSTMGTATTTITSGSVSSSTPPALSGYSGCQPNTVYNVLPIRSSSAPFAVDWDVISDSHFTDITCTGMGAQGCFHVNYGSIYLTHPHPVYSVTELVADNELHIANMEHDSTIGGYGIVHTTNPTTQDQIEGGNYTFANSLNFKYPSYVKYVLGSKTTPFIVRDEICDIGGGALPGTNTFYQEILYSDGTTPDTTTHKHLVYKNNSNCKSTDAAKGWDDDPTATNPLPVSYTQINCWGDSLTAGGQDGGTNYCAVLGTLSGLTTNNYGISGQTSTQIAVRTGAVATTVSNSFTIPTSGGVTVTFPAGFEPAYNANTTGANCVLGTIDGVQGCLSDNGSHVYTFTRSTSGSTVAVTAGDAWIPVIAPAPTGNQASLTGLNVFWAGRNNFTAPGTVLSDVAAMVAAVPAGSTYLVLSIPTADSYLEWPGAQFYEQIEPLNQYLAANYPQNYIDIRRVLISQAKQTISQDQITFGHDVTASSQRAQYSGGTLVSSIDNVTCVIQASSPALSILAGSTLIIDSERIYVQSTTNASTTATCLRGYAGTTAASHTSGTAVSIIDNLHLGGATGYTTVANQVYNWISSYPLQTSNWITSLHELNGALSIQRELNQPISLRGTFTRATMNGLVSPSNLFQGQQALTWITSGTNNVAYGKSALFNLTTGSGNTAIGQAALQTITTLSNMTAIGTGAFSADTTGNNGVAVGANCLTANTTGGNNVCVGAFAGQANTTGSSLTFLGQNAGGANTTAGNNTAVGTHSMNVGTTGGNNSALGAFSCVTTGTTPHVNNNNDTCLGYNTGANVITEIDNSYAIGANAQFAKSNQGVLGNTTVTEVVVNGTVRLAIGTSPTANSGTLTGTNNGGQITGLSAATSVTITFANGGFTNWVSCSATPTVSLATSPYISAKSLTAVTFTFPSLTGELDYHCDGN